MPANPYYEDAAGIREWIVQTRRELHRFPELMYEEVQTSQLVRRPSDWKMVPIPSPVRIPGMTSETIAR